MNGSGYYYAVDAKFTDVIQSLERKGWEACLHHTHPNCCFRYTNYVKIQWKYVKPHHVINHLEHAILLSQKHEFLAHIIHRARVEEYFPRSTTKIEAWKKMFLYGQALVVLKNPHTYVDTIEEALLLGAEIMRLNPDPEHTHQCGLCLVCV